MKNSKVYRVHMLVLLGALVTAAQGAAAQTPSPGEPSQIRREKAYPTGDKASSILLLERLMPAEVRLGQPLTYTLKVTNLTAIEVQDVVLTEQLPPGLRTQNIEPKATRAEARQAVWEWKKLAPRESKSIRVTGLAETVGELDHTCRAA